MQQLVDYRLHFGDAHHVADRPVKISTRGLNFWYGAKHALIDVDLDIYDREVLALVGPSGCGKSTYIRCLNRTNEAIPGARHTGSVVMHGRDVYDPDLDPVDVRRRFGVVAQKPDPFPRSIFANVAYGLRLRGLCDTSAILRREVEAALQLTGLWDEVKDRLGESGTSLSGGQQQRLCIARAIAYRPEVLLLDEPCSALDPNATARIEDLIERLRREYAIVIITHNIQQAARISQRTAFFHLGRLVEAGDTETMFVRPRDRRTQDFVTGRYG
jgi:phosphate transport system ATP-binding protein